MIPNDIIMFSTYNDFFNRRNIIKREFNKLNSDSKRIYRMYLYAQREFTTNKLDLIWEFLNEPDNSIDCPSESDLKRYFVKALEHDIEYNQDYHDGGDYIEY